MINSRVFSFCQDMVPLLFCLGHRFFSNKWLHSIRNQVKWDLELQLCLRSQERIHGSLSWVSAGIILKWWLPTDFFMDYTYLDRGSSKAFACCNGMVEGVIGREWEIGRVWEWLDNFLCFCSFYGNWFWYTMLIQQGTWPGVSSSFLIRML